MKQYYIMPAWASEMYSKRVKKDRFLINSFSFIAQDILKSVANKEEKILLDVGMGSGTLLIELAKKELKNTLIGVDISPYMVEVAKKNLEQEHITKKIEFQNANVIDLPFENNSIDNVVSTFSIHEWPEPEKALSEILKKLKNDGIALIYDVIPSFSDKMKKDIIKDYGMFSYFYLKSIGNSFGKTLKDLETFISGESVTFQYNFEVYNTIFKMIFTKKNF